MRISARPILDALTTPHGLDRFTELVDPLRVAGEPRARVTGVHRPTADSVTLTLRPNSRWRGFRAGQYVRVTVTVDGVRRSRCYSPAGSERSGEIELTVKAHEGGLVSGYLYRCAHPGMVLGLAPAAGEFTVDSPRPRRLLLISGGSGITPVMSMVRTLADEGYRGEVVFLHYARTADDVPYRAELEALARRHSWLTVVVAGTRQPVHPAISGRFSAEHLRAVAPWYAQAPTYLCGPPSLTEEVRGLYEQEGLAGSLHTEAFTASPVAAGEADGEVRFSASGITAANNGDTLLEQAEAAGLHPEHGCRMGICLSCTSTKRTGCVRNIKTGDTSAEEDEDIQLCVSAPVGDVAVDV